MPNPTTRHQQVKRGRVRIDFWQPALGANRSEQYVAATLFIRRIPTGCKNLFEKPQGQIELFSAR